LISYFFITLTYHAPEKILFLGIFYSTNWNLRSVKKFVKAMLRVFFGKWCSFDLAIFWFGTCVRCKTWRNPVYRVMQVVTKDNFEFSLGVFPLLLQEGRALVVPWFTGCSFVWRSSLLTEWLSTRLLFPRKISMARSNLQVIRSFYYPVRVFWSNIPILLFQTSLDFN
jgi:hypothetical protein